jgi:tetratricopeptide (TPR) repeat protein
LKERKYEECIEICDYALEHLTRFHYDNDIWFKRRKALSLIELENQDDGFEILMNLSSNRKGEKWFIFHEIAKIYLEKEEYSDALEYCVKAIALPRDEEKKINLYADTARCLYKLKRFEDARLMADFIAAVTAKYNLKQKSDILKIFDHFKIKPEDISDPKSAFFATKKKILDMFGVGQKEDFKKKGRERKGRERNNSEVRSDEELLKGRVIKILHDNERGKDGFLICDHKQYYFSVSANFQLTPEIKIDTTVEFKILPAKEGKKEQLRITKIISPSSADVIEKLKNTKIVIDIDSILSRKDNDQAKN